jgi:glycosyltransferase involved in cell wall biosynthesis
VKISIITVCRNSEKTIETTIKSVISQTYKNIEYIIIDGDSKDKTKDIVLSYGDRISKFVSESDKSLWEAMNKAIKLATGDFIYFINSDDYIYDRNVIDDVVTIINKKPELDFIYGDVEVRQTQGKRIIQKSPTPNEIIESMILRGTIPHVGSFIEANLFQTIGLYNENYRLASDYEWITKLIHDPDIKLFYFPRVIASFYAGGLSSHVQENLTEIFAVQNYAPIYQTEYWINKRFIALQTELIEVQRLSDERFAFIESTIMGKLLLAIKKGINLLKSVKLFANDRSR